MTTLLLDSDIFAFQAASVNQHSVQWDTETTTTTVDLQSAQRMLDENVDRLADKLQADRIVMCLTDSVNWRHTVLPSYKMNRHGLVKPLLLKEIKQYIIDQYETYIRPTLEADDCLGILATHKDFIKGKKIIVSEDKDLQTIPGLLFNPRKDNKPRLITEEHAARYHMYQTLLGDAVDGYRGCPGIGKVKAEKILSCDPAFYWHAVVQAFEDKGLTEQDALVQARVARICRHTDYNYSTKEVILWQPS